MILTPDSWGSTLTEFNPCHDPKDGKFAMKGQGNCEGAARRPPQVSSVDDAVALILAGKDVELKDVQTVNTVLTKLAAMAKDAAKRGERAPNYNLCRVSVAGTNVFCAEHRGISRIEMPQMAGFVEPGTAASKLPKRPNGRVDATSEFISHLKSQGIEVEPTTMPAAQMKASQRELVGPKVASMMTDKRFNPKELPIFVSRDHYVVDGHHRWAAAVGRDASDNRLGDLTLNVWRVDAPISRILRIANEWTKSFGIKPETGG